MVDRGTIMKKFVCLLLLVVALGAAFLAGGKYGRSDSSTQAHRVLYYVDPMHPAYK